MKIVTTPMCEEVLKMAGVSNYIVNKYPDQEDADMAIVLSETETEMDSIKIKLNTFIQIQNSIITVSELTNTKKILDQSSILEKRYNDSGNGKELLFSEFNMDSPWVDPLQREQFRKNNRKIKVKVYSNFLKDIIEDMGYIIVEENQDFVVYPDYLENKIKENLIKDCANGAKSVKIPSHGDVPLNPVERAQIRYDLLERELCMKP